jgi:hypothetical protein
MEYDLHQREMKDIKVQIYSGISKIFFPFNVPIILFFKIEILTFVLYCSKEKSELFTKLEIPGLRY